eukprot:12280824-Karenia_brevis.AAC.1
MSAGGPLFSGAGERSIGGGKSSRAGFHLSSMATQCELYHASSGLFDALADVAKVRMSLFPNSRSGKRSVAIGHNETHHQ